MNRPSRACPAVVWLVLVAVIVGGCCPAAAESLVFAVFGDTQPGPNYERLDITHRLVSDMVRHNPAFVIGTGDYIDGSTDPRIVRAQFQRFFEALLPLKSAGDIPVAFAAGNHDIRGSVANGKVFDEYFGARRYSFNRGNCHFIILDSEIPGQEGCIKGDQWAWLMADLQEARDADFVFAALHRPLFPVDGHRGSSMDVDIPLRDRLHALFAKYKVSAVFSGHEHLYHYSRRDNIDYFITGGGGGPLYATRDKGGIHHYLLVTVEEGAYTVKVYPLAGDD